MPRVSVERDGERERIFLVRAAAALAADRDGQFAARQDHGAAARGLQLARQPRVRRPRPSRASPSTWSPRKTHS